jgi:phosphoenolpyruvate synthase/pyruvate phosphate dikinase
MTLPTIDEIKKEDWQYLADRREAPIIASSIFCSYKQFRKITLIPCEVTKGMNANASSLFYSKSELDKIRAHFANSNMKVLNSFVKNMVSHLKNLDKYSMKISKINFSKCSQEELNKETINLFDNLLRPLNFFLPFPAVDGTISQRITSMLPTQSDEEKQKWLFVLTYPEKENEHAKEQRSFFNLIKLFRKGDKSLEKSLKEHLNKFSWLGARWYWLDKAWTREDLINRINEFISQGKDEDKELQNLINSRKDAEKNRDELTKNLKLDKIKGLSKILKFAREFAFLRTYRSDVLYRSGYRAVNLLREVSKRAGLDNYDFVYFTNDEILNMSRSKEIPISEEEINKRKIGYTIIYLNSEVNVLSGTEWRDKLQFLLDKKIQGEIKGNPAFPGKVRGKVRLVYQVWDIKKVQRGDILVAVMTFPSFIPAMEKASAFITDEGGILCHAAIVSREMRKPCIIGTKIATKVLKDGDLVEVDADKGTVKKL